MHCRAVHAGRGDILAGQDTRARAPASLEVAVDHPLPWLRYVDADSVTMPDLDVDGMKVRNDANDKLGTVDGFIVDSDTMRPYYLVVDSGGWFKSKHFLVPIGHARIDQDSDALVVDISRDRIERFPGFDRDRFAELSEADMRRINDDICTVTSGTTVRYAANDPLSAAWTRPDYRQPGWWTATADRIRAAASATTAARSESQLERDKSLPRDERDRDLVTASGSEPSPHFDGRAQPGDVLGLETGGEQTHVGETSEDENKRRIDAERTAAKRRE